MALVTPRGAFTIPLDRSGMVPICFTFFVMLASEGAAIRAGSKMDCLELCNFRFCCAFISCQPMKKFECFGVPRATCQGRFKTSSTGDENVFGPRYVSIHFETGVLRSSIARSEIQNSPGNDLGSK